MSTKFIKTYDEIANLRRGGELLNESVYKVEDNFKVRATIDVPQSLVNKISKKVKDETGRDTKEIWSDVDLAEAIVQYVYATFLNEESIPASAITGAEKKSEDAPQGTEGGQPAQAQTQPAQTPATPTGGEPAVHIEETDMPPVQVQQ